MNSELQDLIKGRTWRNIYDLFWTIGILRYVSYGQLKSSFPDRVWRSKCATPKILQKLAEREFLNITDEWVLTITKKSLEFLANYSFYNTEILSLPSGTGSKESLYNTEVLLKLIQLPDFFAVFYPSFYEHPDDTHPFLIPDGALVFKRNSLIKLIFLEIERKKPNWEEHIRGKRPKYETIASDYRTWDDWWRKWCSKLKLDVCPLEEFCFTVWCIGEFEANWEGWQFIENLDILENYD